MKVPDKIYLEKSLSFPDRFHSQWYKEDVVGNGVEYIRKDLLLEWAKEQEVDAKLATTDGIYYSGREHAFRELIDKLNSL